MELTVLLVIFLSLLCTLTLRFVLESKLKLAKTSETNVL